MSWVLIAWTALMAVWLIAGVGSAAEECPQYATQLEEDACAAGAGIGAALILTIWCLGYVPLGLLWFLTRPRGRDCPACGELVKKGNTTCPACRFDLAAAARGEAQPAQASGEVR
jgi:hypothetical protein